jgi:peptidylprolyl isomerase
MPTSKQRREAARRHLERQLQRRAERDAARKRVTLIASIVGTVALIAVVIVAVVVLGSDNKKNTQSTANGSTVPSGTPTATQPATPTPTPTRYKPAKGATATFEGVSVTGAADLKGYPVVKSSSKGEPPKLLVKDLVVGTGKAATPTSSVTVQYTGVLYKSGKEFDSSWSRGLPATFTLGPGNVIDGFTQGIGGTTGVAPMKVGGRRIIIMPSKLGYGTQGGGAIPPNSPLVFVVDLVAVNS